MKPSQLPWKWLLVGLLAVLLLSIALTPRLIGDTSRFADRVASELSAWTGGKLRFTGPVHVSFFPDVSVRGPIELTDSARMPLMRSLIAREAKISLDLVDLIRGRVTIDAVRLLKPQVSLREGASPVAPAAQVPQNLIANLLTGAPLRVLHVRKGRIKLTSAYGGSSIKDLYAHFDAGEETGAVSGFGSFIFRDATVRYSMESGSPVAGGDSESLPIRLGLTSKPISATINGTASYASELKIDGDMQAKTDDLRRFLKWIGMTLPDGESLKGFSAAGAFHLAGSTLAFDDGSFVLDGNKAVGLLALTAAPRPRLEGTLAFDRLVLDPYLGKSQASAPGTVPAKQGSPFDGALLQYFDADLRISAGEIAAGAVTLGRGGFTVTAKQGVVASELGELELCGGSAEGRLSIDLAQATKPLNLVANFSELSLESCLQTLGLAVPLKGTGSVKAELATEGGDDAELTRNLTGTVKVEVRDGAVPVDFARLLATTTPLDGQGWSPDSASSFDRLDADCRLTAGHILCETLTMQTPGGRVSGAGDVDLPKQTLDVSLSVAQGSPVTASQQIEEEEPKVSIRGSLSQPMIRRADRPTLGEGSLQASPMAPQVLPH